MSWKFGATQAKWGKDCVGGASGKTLWETPSFSFAKMSFGRDLTRHFAPRLEYNIENPSGALSRWW